MATRFGVGALRWLPPGVLAVSVLLVAPPAVFAPPWDAAGAHRAAAPAWWEAVERHWDTAWLFGVPAFGLLLAVAAFTLAGRPCLEDGERARRTLATGALCWVFPLAVALLVAQPGRLPAAATGIVLLYYAVGPGLAMGLWQFTATASRTGALPGRVGQAAVAFTATTLFTGSTLLLLTVAVGLPA